MAALEEALAKYGTPEIFNTDQGGQFTSAAFTGALAAGKIKISIAVDMVDNADALTTCPQQQQQTESLAA